MLTTGKPAVVCLLGPTAAGKTGLAVELTRRFRFDIVSVDSAMVYRGMDIGTAKPAPAVLAEAPHRLIDIREPWQTYSAGEFCADARRCIDEIHRSGRVPLLVGGTFLYFRALQHGLAPLPAADPELRAELDERAALRGWPALHAELARSDPATAARINANDRQRIQRALEVLLITGETMSVLQRKTVPDSGLSFLRLVLLPSDRKPLYQRIERRLDEMLEAGFLDEVSALRSVPEMNPERPAMRSVGYRQLWQHLEGVLSRQEALRQALVATRRYAKRQLTWLRNDGSESAFDCLAADVADELSRVIIARGVADAL